MPTTDEEWKRISQAKDEVLKRDPHLLVPEDFPEVRKDILLSWKRSMLFAVDPAGSDIPFDANFSAKSKLAKVAQPVMNRLQDQLSDLSSWGFLADRACRLLTAVVGDSPRTKGVHDFDLRQGLCFAEEQIGTNGIGCAHETQQSFVVSGSEHFRSVSQNLTTTGVIIRDPYTKRHIGTLGVNCRREYGSSALLPLVAEIGRSIEAQLYASRTDSEHAFFSVYLDTVKRSRGPVVGITNDLYLANTEAQEAVSDEDHVLLRRVSRELSVLSKSGVLRRQLSSGHYAQIRGTLIPQATGKFAAVFTIGIERRPGRSVSTDQGSQDRGLGQVAHHHERLVQALGERTPILIGGERGSGKRFAALRAFSEAYRTAEVSEFDATLAHVDGEKWLQRWERRLRDDNAHVLLTHIEDLPDAMIAVVANSVATTRARVIGTTSAQHYDDSPTLLVREAFPVVILLPPLRERPDDFAGICKSILCELDGGLQRTKLGPKTVSALISNDWPGNVRQLRQALATSRLRSSTNEISLADLPPSYSAARLGRALGRMGQIERQALLIALREAGGNRETAAKNLGISRATIYRKLKRYGLR